MFKQIGAHSVIYWCQGTNDIHSSVVQVPRNRPAWERVSCPLHRVWMWQDPPIEINEAQGPLKRKE